jgi:chemotaxis response regulator CheB
MSKDAKNRAIIVSMSGTIQESLRAMLEAMPRTEVIGIAGGGLSAVELVKERHPNVVIIDGNLSEDEILAFLRDVKRLHPAIRLIVLTHTTRQQQRVLDGGADAVLSRWGPANELTHVVIGA